MQGNYKSRDMFNPSLMNEKEVRYLISRLQSRRKNTERSILMGCKPQLTIKMVLHDCLERLGELAEQKGEEVLTKSERLERELRQINPQEDSIKFSQKRMEVNSHHFALKEQKSVIRRIRKNIKETTEEYEKWMRYANEEQDNLLKLSVELPKQVKKLIELEVH